MLADRESRELELDMERQSFQYDLLAEQRKANDLMEDAKMDRMLTDGIGQREDAEEQLISGKR